METIFKLDLRFDTYFWGGGVGLVVDQYATSTFPIMHLICPPSPLPQILHNLCFSFLLGIAVVPREIENSVYARF